MGLASTQTKGKKQLFQAESPDNFSHLFQREEVTLKEKREELAQLLPDLRSLFTNSGGRAKIRFIEGIEGVSRIQEEFLQSGEKMVYGMSSLDDLFRVFPKQTESFSPRRIEKRIHLKFIYTSSQGPILQNANDSLLTESKYIPADKLPFHLDMAVYGDNVALASLRGNVSGVFIEHREIAESLKNLFEFFWNSL
jgi:sugar-specific transcriptional regulator TrmB